MKLNKSIFTIMSCNERTPLKKKKAEFFILTRYEQTADSEQHSPKRRTKSPRQSTELKSEQSMIQSLVLQEHMQLGVNDIITKSIEEQNLTPVIVAFFIMDDECKFVQYQDFEASSNYIFCENTQRAINNDQLCVDLLKFSKEYRIIAAVLIHLHSMNSPMHTVLLRQMIKKKNETDSLFTRFVTPFINGNYYKIIVDFAQTNPQCKIRQ